MSLGIKGNVSQSYTKIPSYPTKISKHQENKQQQMLVRMQRKKGTLIYCLWECKLVQPLWKSVLRFLKKVKIDLGHCHITLGHISEGVSINIQ
jgi:hypothetical protein